MEYRDDYRRSFPEASDQEITEAWKDYDHPWTKLSDDQTIAAIRAQLACEGQRELTVDDIKRLLRDAHVKRRPALEQRDEELLLNVMTDTLNFSMFVRVVEEAWVERWGAIYATTAKLRQQLTEAGLADRAAEVARVVGIPEPDDPAYRDRLDRYNKHVFPIYALCRMYCGNKNTHRNTPAAHFIAKALTAAGWRSQDGKDLNAEMVAKALKRAPELNGDKTT